MASDNGVGKNMTRKNSSVIDRQGQTAGVFGNDPSASPKNGAGRPPRDLRP